MERRLNMRKECYLSQPPLIETYSVFGGTDIILRRNIEEMKKEEPEKTEQYICYECEEVQYRYNGEITEGEIKEKFEYWWALAEGKTEVDAINKDAEMKKSPTVEERIDALESGLADLAEVIANA